MTTLDAAAEAPDFDTLVVVGGPADGRRVRVHVGFQHWVMMAQEPRRELVSFTDIMEEVIRYKQHFYKRMPFAAGTLFTFVLAPAEWTSEQVLARLSRWRRADR